MIGLSLLATITLSQLRAAPTEVRDFVERREGCKHWAGEKPYDKDSAAEIATALRRLRCDRVEKDGAALHRRFRSHPDTLELLDGTVDWL